MPVSVCGCSTAMCDTSHRQTIFQSIMNMGEVITKSDTCFLPCLLGYWLLLLSCDWLNHSLVLLWQKLKKIPHTHLFVTHGFSWCDPIQLAWVQPLSMNWHILGRIYSFWFWHGSWQHFPLWRERQKWIKMWDWHVGSGTIFKIVSMDEFSLLQRYSRRTPGLAVDFFQKHIHHDPPPMKKNATLFIHTLTLSF